MILRIVVEREGSQCAALHIASEVIADPAATPTT